MKISRDYLKKIISEEIKGILKEAFSSAQQEYINNFTSFAKKKPSTETWAKTDVENLINFTPTSGSMTPDEKINATIEAYRKIGMEPGVDSLPSAHKAALLPLIGFIRQWASISAMRIASGKMPDAKQDSGMKSQGDTMAVSPVGPPQPTLSLSGKGGMKCAHAVAVQKQAKQVVQTLASQFGLDDKQTQKLVGRLSDGIMGNTTLGVMKALSGGQMTDKEYPLNSMSSYKKACTVQKELLNSILSMMNTKPQEAADIIMSVVGIKPVVAESKNVSFEKALKAAILKEMKKSS